MNVLIVEDDPMVEFIHRNYLERINRFENVYSANYVESAIELLKDKSVDLILLDIHLKENNGLDMLRIIRHELIKVEVILITAANETSCVQSSFQLGALDYLIKPFTFDRFEKSINRFFEKSEKLLEETLNQKMIDYLTGESSCQEGLTKQSKVLEKGLSKETLHLITSVIVKLEQPFRVHEVVQLTGLSHVSVRKYLYYLESIKHLEVKSIYTKIGRPYKCYYYLLPGD
ncbi:response regulator [Brochothrix campestris]|uniref:Transcriptional regulatory protein n=1 Tax=Brochothrix campestris FSL F6-1037 TaxID=1265861 RepID=W7CYQ9_9LIST|nr:response regulator [Brochothrix campestris]EUJ41880.1 response regulator protein [Brochothrix campestris FSL F6-1037]